MHGNVSEWCEDGPREYTEEQQEPQVHLGAVRSRVVRGGSWLKAANGCRSAYRGWLLPFSSHGSIGFRPAKSLTP